MCFKLEGIVACQSWNRDVVIARQEPLLEPRRAACCLMHVVGFSYFFVLQNGMSGAPIACWRVSLGCGVCVGAGGFDVGCFGGGFGDGTSFRERSSNSAKTLESSLAVWLFFVCHLM